jgi:hypothetical protein
MLVGGGGDGVIKKGGEVGVKKIDSDSVFVFAWLESNPGVLDIHY